MAVDSKCHCLELHVEVLGDQNGRVFLGLLNGEASRHYLVIHRLPIGKYLGKPAHCWRGAFPADCFVDENPHRTAAGSLYPAGHFFGLVVECLREKPVHGACIGSAFRLLVLKAVEFAQDLHGYKEMVVFEAVKAVGVVQEHIGIEHEVLNEFRGPPPFGSR